MASILQVEQKILNAADQLQQMSADILTTGSIKDKSVEAFMDENAAGGLYPRPTAVKSVISRVTTLPNFSSHVLEALKEEFDQTDFDSIEGAHTDWFKAMGKVFSDDAWITKLLSDAQTMKDSLELREIEAKAKAAAANDSMGDGSTSGNSQAGNVVSSGDRSIISSYKISSNIQIPKYDGTFKSCANFFVDFTDKIKELKVKREDYFGILNSHLTGSAASFVRLKKPQFGTDFALHRTAMIEFFDNISPDDIFKEFSTKHRQQRNA